MIPTLFNITILFIPSKTSKRSLSGRIDNEEDDGHYYSDDNTKADMFFCCILLILIGLLHEVFSLSEF